MTRSVVICLLCIVSATSWAGEQSSLGIDYLDVAKNKLIAEAMLEMEPALIEYYKNGEYKGSTESDWKYALRLTAHVLGIDRVSKDTYEVISEVAPNTPLKFLKLDRGKYPNLWGFGESVRLTKVEDESRRLYRALHGKDYKEETEN